jgi:hypothetical protein
MRNLSLILTWALFSSTSPSQGQDTTARPEQVSANAALAAEFAVLEAKRYDIQLADRPSEKLQLTPQPVLRWSNSTRGEVHGSVVLWTRDGCPEAAASIYRFFDREQVNIELVSLSEAPLHAIRNNKLRWAPEASVEFKKIPNATEPAESAEKRQLQARSLARDFSAQLADRGNDARLSELRLMPRPLLQYRAKDRSGREGAVFAFVTTTDPEILLLIESRVTPTGREWVFGCARMHFCRLQLKHKETIVWSAEQAAPPWDTIRGPNGPYVILQWPTPKAAETD